MGNRRFCARARRFRRMANCAQEAYGETQIYNPPTLISKMASMLCFETESAISERGDITRAWRLRREPRFIIQMPPDFEEGSSALLRAGARHFPKPEICRARGRRVWETSFYNARNPDPEEGVSAPLRSSARHFPTPDIRFMRVPLGFTFF